MMGWGVVGVRGYSLRRRILMRLVLKWMSS